MWRSYYQITLIGPRRGLVPSANLPLAVCSAPHLKLRRPWQGSPAEGLTGAVQRACRSAPWRVCGAAHAVRCECNGVQHGADKALLPLPCPAAPPRPTLNTPVCVTLLKYESPARGPNPQWHVSQPPGSASAQTPSHTRNLQPPSHPHSAPPRPVGASPVCQAHSNHVQCWGGRQAAHA